MKSVLKQDKKPFLCHEWNTFQLTTTVQPILKLAFVLRIALYYYKTIWEFYVIGNNENKAKYKKKESVTEEKEEGSS